MFASWLFNLSYRRFRTACETPLEAQADRLRRILRQAANTEIGRTNGFADLSRQADPVALIREYQKRVPIRSYQQMRGDLDAVHAGEWRRLCPSRPLFFAMTAGSTGRFKCIPITREFQREVGRGSLIFNGALEANYPMLRGLKCQFLVGSAEGGFTPTGTPQGFMSGFNYKNLPRFVRKRFALPYWIFTLHDVEDRSYAAGRLLVGERRLGALCAISPVNLINVKRALENNADRLCHDIEAGTLTLEGTAAVGGSWRGTPDPELAAALREARRREGCFPARLLFPSLRVMVCWQGGNMSYYLHELDASFGIVQHFEFPVSASEGLFAIPCRKNQAGGTLAVTTHFLEFVPEDQCAPATSLALRADELEVGVTYRIVVTTSGGLYRYDMEDLVRVNGKRGCTPVIEFISKVGRQVSVANERLTEADVTVAMQVASRRCDLWVDDFLFVPCTDRRFRVMVDGETVARHTAPGRDGPLREFALELERQLRSAAMGYDFERDDALLEPLQLIVTARGQLAESSLQGNALPNAQIKPRHLTTQFDAHRAFHSLGTYEAHCA